MPTIEDIIQVSLEKKEVMNCLEKALKHDFIDNLRHRHPNVQLDNKLRGYIGEYAFKKWISNEGIQLGESNVNKEENGMDIDFIFQKNGKNYQLELKTSLIPDADQGIEQVMEHRDIKLIRRKQQSIEQLSADIHIQLIFKQLRLRKDEWLKKQTIDLKLSAEELYNKLAAFRYEQDVYLVGWIDKPTLIKNILMKPEHLQKWKYGMREFWCCNLSLEAEPLYNLKDYLISI